MTEQTLKSAAAPAAPAAPATPAAPAPAAPKAAAAPAAADPKAVAKPAAPTAPNAEPREPVKTPAKAAAPAPAAADPKAAAKPAAAPDLKLGDEPVDEEAEVPQLGDDPVEEAAGDDAAAPADAEAEGDDKPAEDAPIEYSFEAPEGQEPYRAELLDAYKAVLGKHKVAPEVAQEILQTMLPAIQADVDQRIAASIEAKSAEWRAELQARHGKNTRTQMNLANRGLAKAASPEFRTFIRESALAWHPDLVDLLAFVGKRVTNDRSVTGSGEPPQQQLDPISEAAAEYDRNERKRGN